MELVDLPVPQPKANEAVVKLAASGVNFIDVYFREGRYKTSLPFVPGQEGSGVVDGRGRGCEVREAGRPRGVDRADSVLTQNMPQCRLTGWSPFRRE